MDNIDSQVDIELEKCITDGTRSSFFLFAGAGSGKTHSLVELLGKIKEKWGDKYQREHRKVAVITFTNAATDEIVRRMEYNDLFHVATIHSFLWDAIKTYQRDIKKYYKEIKTLELDELKNKQASAKNKTTKTYLLNQAKIEKLSSKLSTIDTDVKKFIYNPNGDNLTKDSLNHSDIIKIGTRMILENVLLQKVIVQQYPFFLVDESQDTKKELIEVLFKIQKDFAAEFTLGFLGDIKQRIYVDGAENMQSSLDESWRTPIKRMNYRCSKRIVELANAIALTIDSNGEQHALENAPDGFVHLFIIDNSQDDTIDDESFESKVCVKMATISGDGEWLPEKKNVKMLILEHLMAAKRLGFADFHNALAHLSKYQMSYLQGEIPELSVIHSVLLPLYGMIKESRGAESLELLKKYSPLLNLTEDDSPFVNLRKCNDVVTGIIRLIDENATLRDIIVYLVDNKLFDVDGYLVGVSKNFLEELCEEDKKDERLVAWTTVMDIPIHQIIRYYEYVQRKTKYDTHQGVKGLEFPRVLVIINDDEARGFLFSYDKLFGVKELSKADLENQLNGKESSVERTTRLLYVTCTRAIESLALLLYTSTPEKAKNHAIEMGWFKENEISILPKD